MSLFQASTRLDIFTIESLLFYKTDIFKTFELVTQIAFYIKNFIFFFQYVEIAKKYLPIKISNKKCIFKISSEAVYRNSFRKPSP